VSSNKGRERNKTQRLQQARGKEQEKPPRKAVKVSRILATLFLKPGEVPSGREGVSLVDIFDVAKVRRVSRKSPQKVSELTNGKLFFFFEKEKNEKCEAF